MRVLVACEFSGVVRDAFIAAGIAAAMADQWGRDDLPLQETLGLSA